MAKSKKAVRKKAVRKKKAGKKAKSKSTLELLEESLPKDLRSFAKRMQRNLVQVEKEIETARKARRRRWARMLKETSHRLGKLEAEGEKQWRKQTRQARRDAAKLLHRIEKAIDPGPVRKKSARKKKTAAAA